LNGGILMARPGVKKADRGFLAPYPFLGFFIFGDAAVQDATYLKEP